MTATARKLFQGEARPAVLVLIEAVKAALERCASKQSLRSPLHVYDLLPRPDSSAMASALCKACNSSVMPVMGKWTNLVKPPRRTV